MDITTAHHQLDLTSRTHVMGILNLTPDSFSDGGQLLADKDLLARTEKMIRDGADILDIGGESTRPMAPEVELGEELDRVIPAIESIRQNFSIPISIDTSKAEVASQALAAGADIINDISAMANDPAMIKIAVKHQAPVIIMHMQGTPRTMQINPSYNNVVDDICAILASRIDWIKSQGLGQDKIIIDPGIGFGKTIDHNLCILANIDKFNKLQCPVLIGHSRKSFIGSLLDIEDPADRDEATAVISALCAQAGAAIVRVHDVDKTVKAIKLTEKITKSPC